MGPLKKMNVVAAPLSRSSNSYSSSSSSSSSSLLGASGFSTSGIMFSLSLFLLIVFIILLVVHYTVRPIFTFKFGQTGLFGLSNTNDGELFWTTEPAPIDISANILRMLPCAFTVQQDLFISNNMSMGSKRRVFFYRSRDPINVGNKNTDPFHLDYPDSNLLMYLAPGTNDLSVSALTLKGTELYVESAPTVLNVPVNRVFRLTVILLERMLEVYLNGKLVGTKTFRYPLKQNSNYFFGTPQLFASSVKVMNLQYWDRPLSAVEVMKAPPALADPKKFGADISTCGVDLSLA